MNEESDEGGQKALKPKGVSNSFWITAMQICSVCCLVHNR